MADVGWYGLQPGQVVLALVGLAVPTGDRLDALLAWLRNWLPELGMTGATFDWEAHPGGPAVFPEPARRREQGVSAFGSNLTPSTIVVPFRRSNSGPDRAG